MSYIIATPIKTGCLFTLGIARFWLSAVLLNIATKPIASDRMVAELPAAQKITLQPGGHMALMEQNRQFSQVVDAFCATGSEISELP
ncbi:alpha/beta hydrolase fold protein [Nostoc sp. HK-01]|nr:alpha/beta hydrolase fold protein [Nostoc sp. HK-01]